MCARKPRVKLGRAALTLSEIEIMLYKLPTLQPTIPLSYEEEKPTMLGFLAEGCWLEDTLPEDYAGDPNVVLPKHQPIFSAEGNEKFAFPESEHVNGLVREEMVAVHLTPWALNEVLGVRENLRRFDITDKGRQYLTKRGEHHGDR